MPAKSSSGDRKSETLSNLARSISPSVFVAGTASGSNVSLTVEDLMARTDLSTSEFRHNAGSFGQSLGKQYSKCIYYK